MPLSPITPVIGISVPFVPTARLGSGSARSAVSLCPQPGPTVPGRRLSPYSSRSSRVTRPGPAFQSSDAQTPAIRVRAPATQQSVHDSACGLHRCPPHVPLYLRHPWVSAPLPPRIGGSRHGPPAEAACAGLTSVPGPTSPLVPSPAAPGPGCVVQARRTPDASGSAPAVVGPPGRCSPVVCNLDCPD